MDLFGKKSAEGMSGQSWRCLLNLGMMYGWEPAGTQAPDPDLCYEGIGPAHWDESDYCSNTGQLVTDEDANALADALERALPDIPEHHVTVDIENVESMPVEWFSGDGKNRLMEMIAFLREGEFEIW
jgi:hypothetical protein